MRRNSRQRRIETEAALLMNKKAKIPAITKLPSNASIPIITALGGASVGFEWAIWKISKPLKRGKRKEGGRLEES